MIIEVNCSLAIKVIEAKFIKPFEVQAIFLLKVTRKLRGLGKLQENHFYAPNAFEPILFDGKRNYYELVS